jgi:hypothetical protein
VIANALAAVLAPLGAARAAAVAARGVGDVQRPQPKL